VLLQQLLRYQQKDLQVAHSQYIHPLHNHRLEHIPGHIHNLYRPLFYKNLN